MVQKLTLKIAGLYTSPNELESVPEGALLKADNIDIIKDDIAEPRRGFGRLSAGFSTTTDRSDVTFFYQDKQFAHHGTFLSADELSYFNAGAWNSVGSVSAPSANTRIKHLLSNQNLYFTSSSGIKKLDAYNATLVNAGADKALDIESSLHGGSGFLSIDHRVAYRMIFGYKDANDNLILGAPSGRTSIKNTSGSTSNVSVTSTIPDGVTVDWICQLYRSAEVDNSASYIEPNDELQLVFERKPTSAEITAGTLTIIDEVPDELRGPIIYTAPTQETIAYQNEIPPLAEDIALFKNVTFYANVTSKHRYNLTLTSVGGTNGIGVNDTITIGGVTYTAKSGENIANAHFEVFTSGSLSASQKIAETAKSLVRVINRHTNSTVYAFYLSGPTDLPGLILLEERSIGGGEFYVLSSKQTCWNPSDIPTSGTTSASANDRFKNGLFWSKPLQPEAVPLVNQVRIGSEDSEILRVIPLREALYIFKEDGIFRLTGSYPIFDVELLDASAKLIGRETPAILNNQIYCLTDQGVSVVSDGVRVISRPIEESLRSLFADDLDVVKNTSFGVSYETERKYHLFLVSSSADTYPKYSYVFNVFTNAWTKHLFSATAGIANKDNLYLSDADSHYVVVDQKSFNYLDYADYGFQTTITNISGDQVTLNSGIDNISEGDIIKQSDTVFAVVTSTDNITGIATVNSEPGFTNDACDILKAIPTDIKWVPIDMENPGMIKQHHTVIFLFKYDYNGTGYMVTETDLSPAEETTPLVGLGSSLWGLFNWGEARWGGVNLRRPIRMHPPRNKQRCSQFIVSFRHSWGYSPWELQGVTVFAEMGSEKVGR